jgi:hypothetical protein
VLDKGRPSRSFPALSGGLRLKGAQTMSEIWNHETRIGNLIVSGPYSSTANAWKREVETLISANPLYGWNTCQYCKRKFYVDLAAIYPDNCPGCGAPL